MKPFLYPLPAAQPAHAERGEAAKPVAQRADEQASHWRASGKQHSGIESVGRKRHHCGCQKRAEEKAPETIGLEKIEHRMSSLLIIDRDLSGEGGLYITTKSLLAFNSEDFELHGASRDNDIDFVASALAEESLGKGRGDRDFGLLEVGLAFRAR